MGDAKVECNEHVMELNVGREARVRPELVQRNHSARSAYYTYLFHIPWTIWFWNPQLMQLGSG